MDVFEGYRVRSLICEVTSVFEKETNTWTTTAIGEIRRSIDGINWEVARLGTRVAGIDVNDTILSASRVVAGLIDSVKEEDFIPLLAPTILATKESAKERLQ